MGSSSPKHDIPEEEIPVPPAKLSLLRVVLRAVGRDDETEPFHVRDTALINRELRLTGEFNFLKYIRIANRSDQSAADELQGRDANVN